MGYTDVSARAGDEFWGELDVAGRWFDLVGRCGTAVSVTCRSGREWGTTWRRGAGTGCGKR